MQTISNFITSKGGLASILAGLTWLSTQFAPVIPSVWGNFITAGLALIAFYYHGKAVSAARSAGVGHAL
jgi:hypothetical protein